MEEDKSGQNAVSFARSKAGLKIQDLTKCNQNSQMGWEYRDLVDTFKKLLWILEGEGIRRDKKKQGEQVRGTGIYSDKK